jgi:hypothetical protein
MAVSSTAVRFDFYGRDVSAGRTAKDVDRKFSGLGKTAATVGKALAIGVGTVAVGGIAALSTAMVRGVKDASAYQTLASKTAAVIKSTGNQAHITVKGVQSLAGSLENLSGVDEELIINSQNVLATFTKIRNETGKGNDIFTQATRAALDMSSALGTDLQGASIQVGKALNDPIKGITALRKVGVSFTQQQIDQVKVMVESGRTMDAQKFILKELNTEFGGAAKAAGSGFSGAMARAKDAGSDLARDMGMRVLPALTEFADWFSMKGIPKLRGLATYVEGQLVPRVVGGIGSLKGKIESALPNVDWSGLGKGLRQNAASWGGELIKGVQTGLDNGDWGPLGRSLGDGLGKALDSAVGLGASITKSIGTWFSEVDWFSVGAAVGKQTAPFAIGFMSKLGENLFTTIKEHPWDSIVAITAFLGVGKIGGIIAKIFMKIPILKHIAPWFQKWNDLTGPINNAIGGFFRLMGKGFTTAIRKFFPEVGTKIVGRIRGLADAVALRAMYMQDAAMKFLRGIPTGIGKGLGMVTGAIGKVIVRILSPFRGIVNWLVDEGKNLVSGLGRGIRDRFGTLSSAIGSAVGRVTGPFRNAGTWLLNEGRQVLGGLLGGIREKMAGIGGWIKATVVDPIISKVKSFFGIHSPSRVMAGIGGHLVTGLVQGMARQNPQSIVTKIFGSMPKALGALVNKGLLNISSLPSRAMKALSGLGGKFAGLLDGIGLGGVFKGGGGGSGAGLVAFGRWLQEMGYTVAEHPAFGGVGTHSPGSAHYSGRAIDVNRGAGTSSREQAYLSKIIGPAHAAGFKTIFMAPGHYNHAHIAYDKGGVIGEPVSGVGRWSGKSYSFAEHGNETVIPGGLGRGTGGLTVVVNVNGPVAGSALAVENMVVAAVDTAKRKGRIKA